MAKQHPVAIKTGTKDQRAQKLHGLIQFSGGTIQPPRHAMTRAIAYY
jgi:hypothetical protein